ncbi:hypothetical protein [Neptuniibacter halophilus]|uniref:hypothetical protein n=1 Tax=Neptuniibacter halophilus TaxID=651666 RepID=UPI0025742E90|nr:hypothetical protein [Neptuniibacter halophilus]
MSDSNIYQAPEADLAQPGDLNNSGQGKVASYPDGVRGWSWGGFFFNWLWAIFNRTWIGLLALVPYIGFVMVIVLGIKGRQWAWENKRWDSVEHFQRVQRRWSIAALIFFLIALVGILAAIAIPAYQDYVIRASGG